MKVTDEKSHSNKKYLLIFIFLIIAIICIIYNLKTAFTTVSGYIFVTKWNYEFTELDYTQSRQKSIATDSYGYVYLTCGSYVQKFDSDGKFIIQWGKEGDKDRKDEPPGFFQNIRDICIDSSDHIYLLDPGNNRIQKFVSSGDFLGMCNINGTEKIAVDLEDNIYVMLYRGNMVKKFDAEGKFINSWEVLENSSDNTPLHDIDFDKKGYIYVASSVCTGESCGDIELEGKKTRSWSSSIHQFDLSGKLLNQWNTSEQDGCNEKIGSIALDSKGNIFIAEPSKNRIRVFDSTGKFITQWGSDGSGEGQFKDPEDIAIDRDDNVYVVDSGNNRIQKFRPFHN